MLPRKRGEEEDESNDEVVCSASEMVDVRFLNKIVRNIVSSHYLVQ